MHGAVSIAKVVRLGRLYCRSDRMLESGSLFSKHLDYSRQYYNALKLYFLEL